MREVHDIHTMYGCIESELRAASPESKVPAQPQARVRGKAEWLSPPRRPPRRLDTPTAWACRGVHEAGRSGVQPAEARDEGGGRDEAGIVSFPR